LKIGLIAGALLLAGCSHVGNQGAKAPSSPPIATANQVIPAGATSAPAGTGTAAYPAEYEEYYVGMIPDDEDPNFAYRPGDLVVQTQAARFRFDGRGDMSPAFAEGPSTFARMANDHPEPTDTELAAMAAHSERLIAALTEENMSLLAQVQAKPASQPAAPTPAPAGPAAEPSLKKGDDPAPAVTANESHLNIIAPNDDYVIELDPNLYVAPEPATTNPFVQLYQPPVAWRELTVQISAAVPGPKPTAIIDGEPYSVGDRFKDLTVYRVEADTVYLRKDSVLLACPVSERTLRLRLP
jgi:hypothetical protein